MSNNSKEFQYATLLIGAIGEMFQGDSDFSIDEEDLMEDDNLTHFFQALANVAPTHLYNKLTGENVNQLEFNHVANRLCFQYARKKGKNSGEE